MNNPEAVDLAALIRGFVQAHDRFEAARLNRFDELPTYHALFEALAWTYSIDERLRGNDPRRLRDDPNLRGLRYARNSVHHRWDQALWMDMGGELPWVLGQSKVGMVSEWRWKPRLLKKLDSDGGFYESHLAGKPAQETLADIRELLRPLLS